MVIHSYRVAIVWVKFTPMKLYKCGLYSMLTINEPLSTSEAVPSSLVESALKTWLASYTVPTELPN